MTYESIFSARIANVWNSLPNSVVDACTVNAFKARLDKFWQHQSVKFEGMCKWSYGPSCPVDFPLNIFIHSFIHFTTDLTGTGNRSEEVIK